MEDVEKQITHRTFKHGLFHAKLTPTEALLRCLALVTQARVFYSRGHEMHCAEGGIVIQRSSFIIPVNPMHHSIDTQTEWICAALELTGPTKWNLCYLGSGRCVEPAGSNTVHLNHFNTYELTYASPHPEKFQTDVVELIQTFDELCNKQAFSAYPLIMNNPRINTECSGPFVKNYVERWLKSEQEEISNKTQTAKEL